MKKQSTSSEGTIIWVAVMIIGLAAIGSISTGMDPVSFFFSALLFLIVAGLVLALAAGVIILLLKIWRETQKHDGRTLLQIIRDEYHWRKLAALYREVWQHERVYIHDIWNAEPVVRMRGRVAGFGAGLVALWRSYRQANRSDIDDPKA